MLTSRYSLGIDLRDNRLRLAYVSAGQGSTTLEEYLELPLPSAQDNLAEYESVFVENLRKFVIENKIKTEQVVISVAQQDVIFRKIEVPDVKDEDIRQILEFEVERHVPFSRKDIYFDFHVIGPKAANKLDIFFVATKKERVNFLLSLLEKAGVSYSGLELSTFALFNCFNYQNRKSDEKSNCILLDIGLDEVEVGVVQNGNFIFSHSVSKKTLLADTAGQKESGADNVDELAAHLEGGNRRLAHKMSKELKYLMASLEKNFQDITIDRIMLAGGEVSSQLPLFLYSGTQIETSNWNPLQGINYDGFETPPVEGAVAIGLALEALEVSPVGVNLMPPAERDSLKKGSSFVFPLVLSVILFLLIIANGASYLIKERMQLQEIEKRIEELKPEVVLVQKQTQRYQKLRDRMKNLHAITRQPTPVLNILKELTLKLPADAWLENFRMTKKEIELRGSAGAASNLIPVLEASPLFKDVKFTSAITSRAGKDKFKIKITLEE